MARILVVAAHPDDEILGCGATLAKHLAEGDTVDVLLMSRGRETYDFMGFQKETGFNYHVFNNPDQRFETTCMVELVSDIENIALKVNPDIVYTHSSKDLNLDHRLTLEAVLVAFRSCGSPIKILSFEILSSTEYNLKPFEPNYYNNVDGFLHLKYDYMNFYSAEMREYPHPRSMKGVFIKAQSRGLEVGMEQAEAFEIVRIINK